MKNYYILALFLTFCQFTMAQNDWTSCSASAGLLNGATTNIGMADNTPAASFSTAPSPTSAIPNTEFLIINENSIAPDSLGGQIIATSLDGVVNPTALGLMVGDTFTVTAISYDIDQIKNSVQGILNNSVPFIGTCCSVLDGAAPFPGICDSLIAAGINDSSDVNNVGDLLTFLRVFNGGENSSLRGLKLIMAGINGQIGTLSAVGCTNGVTEMCYAMDSIYTNQDHYVVSTTTSVHQVIGNSALQLSVNPNPFNDILSVNIMTKYAGMHEILLVDASGKIVLHTQKDMPEGEQGIQLNLETLYSGIYFLQLNNQQTSVTQKIVKR